MSFQAFEPIAISSESTVVAEFEKETKSSESYQSEDQLEKAFIGLLKEQAYEYLAITEESQLKQNLRESLETLNKITFSDSDCVAVVLGKRSVADYKQLDVFK
jgi:type I restriction enzyme R subunit